MNTKLPDRNTCNTLLFFILRTPRLHVRYGSNIMRERKKFGNNSGMAYELSLAYPEMLLKRKNLPDCMYRDILVFESRYQ